VLPVQGAAPTAGSEVTVLVRPETIVPTPALGGEAVIVVATFQGATTRLRLLRGDSTEVLADVPSHRAGELPAGTRVDISLVDRPVLVADSATPAVREAGAAALA
jgi:putative spermidine/putrescine transport system ATP-binding protein